MNSVTAFEIGKHYTRDQIRMSLRVENLGGIRPSLDSSGHLRHIAILTSAEGSSRTNSDNPYADRIEGDMLVFTAQGRVGNQTLTGRNKRLLDQYSYPVPYYGFANIGSQVYTFLGILELVRHYEEIQADAKRDLRRVWLFEFRIHSDPSIVPIQEAQDIVQRLFDNRSRRDEHLVLDRQIEPLVEGSSDFSASDPAVVDIEITRKALLALNPYRFESLIAEAMRRKGFHRIEVTRASGDGGIDINAVVADEDYFFSKTHVQIQVKRWRHSVGSVEINGFRGALNTNAKGVFITTSQFTKAATVEASHPIKPGITLLDGARLSTLINDVRIDISLFNS